MKNNLSIGSRWQEVRIVLTNKIRNLANGLPSDVIELKLKQHRFSILTNEVKKTTSFHIRSISVSQFVKFGKPEKVFNSPSGCLLFKTVSNYCVTTSVTRCWNKSSPSLSESCPTSSHDCWT